MKFKIYTNRYKQVLKQNNYFHCSRNCNAIVTLSRCIDYPLPIRHVTTFMYNVVFSEISTFYDYSKKKMKTN